MNPQARGVIIIPLKAYRQIIKPRSPLLLFILLLTIPSISANAQSSDLVLTNVAEAQLDSLASRIAQKIGMANLEPRKPEVLVIDFAWQSPDQSSLLGTILADRFSGFLKHYSNDVNVVDRKVLDAYLRSNWSRIEDLHSASVCLAVARELGATGIIRANLIDAGNSELKISLQVSGLGPQWSDLALIPMTKDMQTLLSQPVRPYFQESDAIPVEPGVLRYGPEGAASVDPPSCISCPMPHYSKLASVAKIQGTVTMSVIVTKEGKVTSIYVLKGMPLGMTQNAIDAVKSWQMKPALRNGEPVEVRTTIETTFRLI